LLATLAGCDRQSARIRALEAENEQLKQALKAEHGESHDQATPRADTTADLDLSLTELWTQRFEDNQFRAKQRLDQKQIRVTGMIQAVSERSVTLFDTGARLGAISLDAQIDGSFLRQNMDGLASLQKGAKVTLQGRFLFDKMRLENAVFVERASGKLLSSKDLVAPEGAAADAAEPQTTSSSAPRNSGND
jgi:hypothetical protein